VDRIKFQEMFKRETTQAANKKTSELLTRVDNAIEKLKADFKAEWMQNVRLLKDTLEKSFALLEQQLKYVYTYIHIHIHVYTHTHTNKPNFNIQFCLILCKTDHFFSNM
jgi:hypothetical protein